MWWHKSVVVVVCAFSVCTTFEVVSAQPQEFRPSPSPLLDDERVAKMTELEKQFYIYMSMEESQLMKLDFEAVAAQTCDVGLDISQILFPLVVQFRRHPVPHNEFMGYGANKLTLMHLATIRGHDELLEALIAHGADHTAQMDFFGYLRLKGATPLHIAAVFGRVRVLKTLMYVDLKDKKQAFYSNEYTPLHFCADKRQRIACRLLLEAGYPVESDEESTEIQPIHLAAVQGWTDIVELFAKHGANLSIQSAKGVGDTPLHAAADYGRVELVEYLIGQGVDPTIVTRDRLTPLVLAMQGRVELVEYLIGQGVDPTIVTRDRLTPLVLAMQGNHREVVQLLSDYVQEWVNKKNSEDSEGEGGDEDFDDEDEEDDEVNLDEASEAESSGSSDEAERDGEDDAGKQEL